MSMFDTIIQLSQLNVVKVQAIKSNGKKRHGLHKMQGHVF